MLKPLRKSLQNPSQVKLLQWWWCATFEKGCSCPSVLPYFTGWFYIKSQIFLTNPPFSQALLSPLSWPPTLSLAKPPWSRGRALVVSTGTFTAVYLGKLCCFPWMAFVVFLVTAIVFERASVHSLSLPLSLNDLCCFPCKHSFGTTFVSSFGYPETRVRPFDLHYIRGEWAYWKLPLCS